MVCEERKMKTIEDLTTIQKKEINKFFEDYEKKFNEQSLTHLKDCESLFFIYNKVVNKFESFGISCNDAVKFALKWQNIDVNELLEHLNDEYEFVFVNLRYKPTLY